MTKQHLNQTLYSTKVEAIKFVGVHTFDETVFNNYLVKLLDYPHPFKVTRPSKVRSISAGDTITCTVDGDRLKSVSHYLVK